MNGITNGTLCVNTTPAILANDMTCQFTCTLCVSNQFNMFATNILAIYTIYYVILYYKTYSIIHISCIWYDTYTYTPKSFHPITVSAYSNFYLSHYI